MKQQGQAFGVIGDDRWLESILSPLFGEFPVGQELVSGRAWQWAATVEPRAIPLVQACDLPMPEIEQPCGPSPEEPHGACANEWFHRFRRQSR